MWRRNQDRDETSKTSEIVRGCAYSSTDNNLAVLFTMDATIGPAVALGGRERN